ncbi:MAG: response regulator [Nitrospirae bacterium]|nr:response regulator [Nitrospirota bacterium]MBF0539990.1 response regulator [Nitrospirota bacterium]
MLKDNKLKVLIVEDEIIIAREIEDTLIGLGYSVPGIASSADEALSMTEQFRPDLVLMDIIIEGDKDGVDAALEIYNKYKIPVIYLTAHSDLSTLLRARKSLPYGYIIKPFTKRDMVISIGLALYKHKSEMKERIIALMIKLLLEPITFNEKLKRVMELLHTLPRQFKDDAGCVYVVNVENILTIAYQIPSVGCDTNICLTIPMGKCLCGRAAETGEIIISEKMDEQHDIQSTDKKHGHVCIPFKHNGKTLGVLNLYTKEGYKKDDSDTDFFNSVADILTLIYNME